MLSLLPETKTVCPHPEAALTMLSHGGDGRRGWKPLSRSDGETELVWESVMDSNPVPSAPVQLHPDTWTSVLNFLWSRRFFVNVALIIACIAIVPRMHVYVVSCFLP